MVEHVYFPVLFNLVAELSPYSLALCTRDEFLKVLNLKGVDMLAVQLTLNRKVPLNPFFFFLLGKRHIAKHCSVDLDFFDVEMGNGKTCNLLLL